MQHWWYVLAAVGAALAFGTSTHLKHLSAGEVPDAQSLRPTAIGRLVRATLAHRLWLGGIGADAVGLALQLIALHLGPLAAVQPLLILGLLFAVVLRQGHHGRFRSGELGWVLVVTAALIGFLLTSGTASSTGSAGADRGPAIGAAAVGLVLAAACLVLGRQYRGAGRAAASLGITVGIVYASTAALLKTVTNIAVANPVSLLWSWQLYTVLVVGAAGLLLNQLAFQAGPLTASLPAIASVDPLLSVVIGVWIFDERLRHGVAYDVALTALLFALGIGIIQLARGAVPDGEPAVEGSDATSVGRASRPSERRST
jgi:hypothetical protein